MEILYGILGAAIVLPPYTYIVSKFAAAGWMSGVALFVERHQQRERRRIR